MLQQRPNTFAQTILSLSFFACDVAADHTFRFARDTGGTFQTVSLNFPEAEHWKCYRRFALPAGFCLNFRQFAVVVTKRNTISYEA
jgi:hypothetical protein